MDWQVRAIRGAITVEINSAPAIQEAVTELLDQIEAHNNLCLEDVVSVIFSVTSDLNALFPAQVARGRVGWDQIPLLDVQHMSVPGSLTHCIRILIQVNTLAPRDQIQHVYLRRAKELRPDLLSSQSL